jgi:hypothetical protein
MEKWLPEDVVYREKKWEPCGGCGYLGTGLENEVEERSLIKIELPRGTAGPLGVSMPQEKCTCQVCRA